MPTYEYRCDNCEHTFDEFQSMSAKPLRKCPACGKNKLKRLIGIGAGVIFKGSGFYETDYRSESYKNDRKADTETKSDSKSETKAESKSESKSETKSEKKGTKKPAKSKTTKS